eukprot:scaffold13971_cov69-Phaeocystis_antarctica.AAC.4
MSAGRRSCSTSGVHDLPGFSSKKRCLSGVSHTCTQLQGNWFSLTACKMTCLIVSFAWDRLLRETYVDLELQPVEGVQQIDHCLRAFWDAAGLLYRLGPAPEDESAGYDDAC